MVPKRSISLLIVLLIAFFPCVVIPGFTAIIIDIFVLSPAENAAKTSRNNALMTGLALDLDKEIESQKLILDVFHDLSKNLDLTTQSTFGPINSLFENQSVFQELFLVNTEGHILWQATKNQQSKNPSLQPPFPETGIEVRVNEDSQSLDLYHYKSVPNTMDGIKLVGISAREFLESKCATINNIDLAFQVVIFLNQLKIRPLECGHQLDGTKSNDTIEHQYRKMLLDIKQSLNDERFKMKYPDNFAWASSSRSPLKFAIVPNLYQSNASKIKKIPTYTIAMSLSIILIVIVTMIVRDFILNPLRELEDHLLHKNPVKNQDLKIKTSIREIKLHVDGMITSNELKEEQRIRTRVMQKAFMDLFSSDTIDLLIAKSVELLATQTGAIHVLFIPDKYGEFRKFDNVEVFIGVHAWSWHLLKLNKLSSTEVEKLREEIKETRTYDFKIKSSDTSFGFVKVYFDKTPNDFVLSIMHGLISLVETTLSKHERVKKETMISTELSLAAMVQETVMDQAFIKHGNFDIAYYFQPSSRLGGDWFYVFESADGRYLNFFIGDVSGNGLTQGLVATAAKGAMDTIVAISKNHANFELTPGHILEYLNRVMNRLLAKSELTMSCLAAQIDFRDQTLKICNAGHTFPILIRKSEETTKNLGENQLLYLSKNQSPLIGFSAPNSKEKFFENSLYPLESQDMIFIYTDGLSGSKKIKSSVFSGILQRKLRQIDISGSPDAVRNEVLSIHQYYIQDNKIEDDVCFMVVKFKENEKFEKIKVAV